jgi:hypothetical protein
MEPKAGGPDLSSFELPAQPERSPETENQQEQIAEAPPARQEQVGKQPKQPALPVVPDDIPAADQPVIAAPPQDIAAPVPVDPKAVAGDSDHIEREWVDKVKNIVAQTRDDPHLQKEQMSRVKAEYIQKRFNKTIKTDEAAA